MMLLGLALAVQSVTLESDPREATLTCGAAVMATDSDSSIDGLVVTTWFALTNAKETGSVDTLIDRSPDAMRRMGDRVAKVRGDSAELLKQCRTRFPQAWKTSGVTLPSDDFDRRSMCFAVGTMVATYEEERDPAASQRIGDRLGSLLTDKEMGERGLTTQTSFKKEIGRTFTMSLPLGNFQGVTTACEAAFPG